MPEASNALIGFLQDGHGITAPSTRSKNSRCLSTSLSSDLGVLSSSRLVMAGDSPGAFGHERLQRFLTDNLERYDLEVGRAVVRRPPQEQLCRERPQLAAVRQGERRGVTQRLPHAEQDEIPRPIQLGQQAGVSLQG